MRWAELIVTDVADTDPLLRTEWIHRDHIELIRPYLTEMRGRHLLWLELSLTSGDVRYAPVRNIDPTTIDDAARTAIANLIDQCGLPVRAAADSGSFTPTEDHPF